jgi:hypothetical protein
MPCGDPSPYPASRESDYDTIKAHLCWACHTLENAGAILPPDLARWWQQHQEVDARRKQAEAEATHRAMVKRAALEKLTPEERRALGVGTW